MRVFPFIFAVVSAVFLSPSFADSGTCAFRFYSTRYAGCTGGAVTYVDDVEMPAASAAACAAMCGCKPNSSTGKTLRYGCIYAPAPR